MKILVMLTLSLILTGCFSDGGDGSSGGSLFSNHQVTTNAFAMTLPTSKSYTTGEHLDFVATHSFGQTVTGTPRLVLNIGGSSVYADYLSGTGTTSITFRYTIQAGDNDGDGIGMVTAIDLNGGTLKFSNNGQITNSNLNLGTNNTSGILVSTSTPVTISSVTPPSDATYIATNNLDFIVNTSENVDVTGTPRIAIDIGGVTKYADYNSGTGTSALTFRYTVETALNDADGIAITSPIELNGGTLENSSSVALTRTFTSPSLTAVLVDSQAPTVAITSPADSSFINIANNSATFAISGTCNEAGQTVVIEVDSAAATSPVGFSCDGTSFSGTIDTTALSEAAHTLDAKLSDAASNEGVSTTINVTKDITAPVVSSVIAPANATYKLADNLDFIVNLDDNVAVTGTPRIQLTVGAATVYADYLSGTGTNALTFRYTVQAGEEDTNGVDFANINIDINGGTLIDAASNNINLDLTATVGLPSLTSVLVDGVIPTVTITSAANITAANQATYNVTGTCTENGRTVSVNIGGIASTPTCTANAWTTGSVDVSGLADSGSIAITADHSDAAGNNAIQATTSVSKNTAVPLVAITSSPNITAANHTGYTVSGTCTENGRIVDVNIDSINVQPNCSGGTWTTGSVDVSSLADNPSLSITADHDNSGGTPAVQASVSVSKDTTGPVVTISSAPNINLSNQTVYIVSGVCSENGRTVTVNVDSLTFTPTCSSGTYTTGQQDVSSISDGASISVTADHDNSGGTPAPQATATISKNTATPTISSLTVPATLKDSADLNWNLNDPGGFSLDDYEVNYKVKGTGTWLSFADGVSLNKYATVTGLTASTTYEFRVRLKYDGSSFSDWSSTAEGETKPDDPLFNSPNAAMNVGGSTTTSVVAYYDNTNVTLNGTPIAGSPLSKGQTAVIATTQFDIIDADKPIFTAGRLGSGGDGSKANMVWTPTSWAGKSFSFNATRSNPQNLYVYATENATITVKQGGTTLASTTLTAGNGTTLNWSVYGSYQVTSTGTILAFHMSGSGSTRHDPKPIMPGHTEMIGFPSSSMRITTDTDGTNYNILHSNSNAGSGSINKSAVVQVNPQGTSSLYRSESLLVTADKKVSGASFADSNGLCAAPFLPTNLMKKRYIINANSDYVAFASKQAGTIDVYSPSQTIGVDAPVETLTLTRSGGNANAPYKVRRGTTSVGYRFVATVPVAGWYHPSTDTGSADNDETILYGTND